MAMAQSLGGGGHGHGSAVFRDKQRPMQRDQPLCCPLPPAAIRSSSDDLGELLQPPKPLCRGADEWWNQRPMPKQMRARPAS